MSTNGTQQVETSDNDEESGGDESRLIKDPKQRREAGKRLFADYFEKRTAVDAAEEKLKEARDAQEASVKEIYEVLGQRKYDVKGENLTPTKRKDKNSEKVSYFMRGQREIETEKI